MRRIVDVRFFAVDSAWVFLHFSPSMAYQTATKKGRLDRPFYLTILITH